MLAPPPTRAAERIFDAWVRFTLRHRFIVLTLVALLTGLFIKITLSLPMMTGLKDILPNDARMAAHDLARARFGGDETILIAAEAEDHFTVEGLARIEAYTEALEEHPLIERVLSISNANWIRREDGGLKTSPYLEMEDPQAIRAALLGDDLVVGALLSEDARVVIWVIQLIPSEPHLMKDPWIGDYVREALAGIPGQRLDTEEGARRALDVAKNFMSDALYALADKAGYPKIHLSGFPALFGALITETERNIRVLLPLTLVAIGLILIVILRRPSEVLLPILCVLPATAWTMGIGGLTFGHIGLMSSIAPVMVLVVGMSDVVHLMTQYRHELARGLDVEGAIRVAFREVGAACALTSFTTLIGFGSMLFLPLPHIRELGFFSGVGVVIAFLLAFTLTPPLLSLAPAPVGGPVNDAGLSRGLGRWGGWVNAHARLIVVLGGALSVLSVAAAFTIKVENSLLVRLDEAHPLRLASGVIRGATGANGEVEVIIDGGAPDAFKDPQRLAALATLQAQIKDVERVGGVRSAVDILRRLQAAMDPEGPPLPSTPQRIAEYLLLFEMAGGDFEGLLDASGQHARLAVRLPDVTAEEGNALALRFEALAASVLPASMRATAGGLPLLTARAAPIIIEQSMRGLGGALLVIAVLLGLLFRSVRVAFLSVVPNLAPVAIAALAVIVTLPQFDADALIFLTICVGIAVDDTIHFLSRYRIERGKGLERDAAVIRTLEEAGSGIVRTSVILGAGFLVVLSSDYTGVRMVGVLLPITLLFAVALDLSFVPALAKLGLFDVAQGAAKAAMLQGSAASSPTRQSASPTPPTSPRPKDTPSDAPPQGEALGRETPQS
ncbi:MMPL family transporter [Myxococcota bacterium]|nr:MMPL family transporter [Myxococcota bacterium]MBU1430934.1 MMPL family transporter [Myxococcota bacterium]MBU1899535.1 MMPL family transporter [Myxococcota bacterium]